MKHEKSGTIMAVKNMFASDDKQHQKQILDELDKFMHENTSPHVVQYYGVLFQETDFWICMELMNTSLDYFYKFVYHKLDQIIPENILAYISFVILQTLDYLKSRWNIIHRYVKPSNILVSKTTIKLCDFGITDQIVHPFDRRNNDYVAIYVSPERIDPIRATGEGIHGVQSSVWSFGITIYELSTGYYPLPKWKNIFDVLQQILEGPPMILTIDRLSDHCKTFVNTCLNKDENQRPKYKQLLEHPFLQQANDLQQTECAIAYLSDIVNKLEQNTDTLEECYYLPSTSQ